MGHRLAHSWQALFWRGAIAIAFAIAAFVWPMMTLTGVVVLFGAFAILDGALSLVMALRESPRTRWSVVLLAEGLIGVSAGAVAIFLPGVALTLLVALIATWAVTTGALEIAAAMMLGTERTALVASGVASILLGVALVARPTIAAIGVAWLLGIYALVFGGILVAISVRLRRPLHRERWS